jgi:hypothetical protein
VVWDVRQEEHVRLGEVPRWSSPFFEAQRSIVFVPQSGATCEPLLAASHERTRVALFKLDGTLVRATNRINDYVTGIELVHDGKLLVIHCIMWQPISFMHVLRVAEFLAGVQKAADPPCVWQENRDSPMPPVATETHLGRGSGSGAI